MTLIKFGFRITKSNQTEIFSLSSFGFKPFQFGLIYTIYPLITISVIPLIEPTKCSP